MYNLRQTKPTWLFFFIICCAAVVILFASMSLVHRSYKLASNDTRDTRAESTSGRQWAVPMEIEGVENFHKVSDSLYRGAQPSAEGMKQLKSMGIKTVINLRSSHSDRDEIGDIDLKNEHIETTPWDLTDQDVIDFLKIVNDANNLPAFVHCQRGADRTGTMCAVYRIMVQDWTREEALTEMTSGGFKFYPKWKSLPEYIRTFDEEKVKSETGLQPATAPSVVE